MAGAAEHYRDRYLGHGDDGSGAGVSDTLEARVGSALAVIADRPRRVLDFGCTVGRAAERFLAAGHSVVGMDISRSAIEVARKRVPAAEFHLVESETSLPIPDGSVDVVYSSEVIEHLFDVLGFMGEAHRVLSDGGLFLITVPYHGRLKSVLIALRNFEKHYDPTHGHIRFFTPASMEVCLERTGFRVRSWKGVGRAWPLWKCMFVVAERVRRP
jgi:2-polyprenyl-6-hydroxyphenyl methylase/3-demethylubiquinone-9 3-methyltransferase